MIATRRRGYTKTKDSLLYPDAYMAVFSCDAMTTYNLMYGHSIDKYILDGVEVIPTTPVKGVAPSTSGKHVLYFWLNSSERLADINWSGAPEYLRIPANPQYWHSTFVHNAGGLIRLDFLGDTPPEIGNQFGNHIPSLTEIRVPIDSRSAYATALSGAAYAMQQKINSIQETKDFSYNI